MSRVGQRPKKFFHDITPVRRGKVFRPQKTSRRKTNLPQRKKILVMDGLFAKDKTEKVIEDFWGTPPQQPSRRRDRLTFEEAAEKAPKEDLEIERHLPSYKFGSLLKQSALTFVKLCFVALLIYHAGCLYFESGGLLFNLRNLANLSKIRFAMAAEELAEFNRVEGDREIKKGVEILEELKRDLIKEGEYNIVLKDHPLLKSSLTEGQKMLDLGLFFGEANEDLNQVIEVLVQERGSDWDLLKKADYIKDRIKRTESKIRKSKRLISDPTLIEAQTASASLGISGGLIDRLEELISQSLEVLEAVPAFVGSGEEKKYLILFLNNAEMRPGGGFPGNYGELSFKDGNFDNLLIDDIYHLDWTNRNAISRLRDEVDIQGTDPREFVGMPEDLYLPDSMHNLIGKTYWKFFSSNWSLDFKDNARRAENLYENFYGQNEVSGAIVMTPNVVEDILEVLGPIEMKEYGIVLKSSNFREIIEFKVEFDNPFKKEGRKKVNPKQILADFGPLFLERMEESSFSEKIKIGQIIVQNLKNKEMLLYHEDSQVQNIISELGFGGEINDEDGDFLAIYHMNLNAAKNGRMIERTASFKSNISSLGFAMNELSLTIMNTETNPRRLHEKEKSYIEIVVPKGSRLRKIMIEGQELNQVDFSEQAGKTVFGFRIEINPSESKNIYLQYQAPLRGFKEGKNYQMSLLKQPGAKEIIFKGEIYFENGYKGNMRPYKVEHDFGQDKKIEL